MPFYLAKEDGVTKKKKRIKNIHSHALPQCSDSQNGEEGTVSVATAFMDYTFKSPWRQEITTAKIQITAKARG